MKRYSILLLLIIITVCAASCIKDRLQPTAAPVKVSAADTLMYYWDFNNLSNSDTAKNFRVPVFGVHNAFYNYYCAYIDYTDGSVLNLQGTSDSGSSLRLRNPSDSIIFYMPTTGYDSIYIEFAEESSSSGPSQNAISYTTDGVHFISTAFGGSNTYPVTTVFTSNKFSFAADSNTKNNPNFAVKIVPLNNNTGASGNDRIDNVSLHGMRQ